ncbi:MAG: hypothetical protein JWM43_2809 [Acidobacteriaceae bacterium]|nr:hypothetical protein [Acidobacteriaceae bacterium]
MTLRSLWIPFLLSACLWNSPASAAGPHNYRDLTGTVTDPQHEPLRGAVVQVHDDNTLATLSYITDRDGHYSFLRLNGDANYHVWATFRSHESAKHDITPFDTSKSKVIDLVVPLH